MGPVIESHSTKLSLTKGGQFILSKRMSGPLLKVLFCLDFQFPFFQRDLLVLLHQLLQKQLVLPRPLLLQLLLVSKSFPAVIAFHLVSSSVPRFTPSGKTKSSSIWKSSVIAAKKRRSTQQVQERNRRCGQINSTPH